MNWYEQLDFDENPFAHPENARLIGYEEIVNEVLYNIDAGNILFIQAPPGSGKTAILKKAIQQFRGQGKVAYLDCEKIKDLNIERVLEKRSGVLGSIFQKKPTGMIVLVDNIQELDKKNSERLKYFYDQNYVRSIIFTGDNIQHVNFTPSLRDRIKKVIILPVISEEHAPTILKDRLKGMEYFPENIAKKIYHKSQYNLKTFMYNAENLIKKVLERKEDKVTEEHLREYFGEQEHTPKQETKKEQPKPPKQATETKKEKPKAAKKQETIHEEELTMSTKNEEHIAERYY